MHRVQDTLRRESGEAVTVNGQPSMVNGPTLALLAAVLLAVPLAARQAPPASPTPGRRLPGIRVPARSPCQTHPETAVETAQLWVAAREALEGSTRSEPGAPTLLVEKWRGTLGAPPHPPAGRRGTPRAGPPPPLATPLPANLPRRGENQPRSP